MTTVVSPGAEAHAQALGERARRARDWLTEQLAAPFSFDLYVLDEREWADHTDVPVYAIPHADSETGKIVLGAHPAALFGSMSDFFWPDLTGASRAAMRSAYGDPPALEGFADLLVVHELVHLVPRTQPLPAMWFEELFAQLGAFAYFASEEPDELAMFTTFHHAGCDVPRARVPCSALDDMPNSFEEGGPANYAWYQCRLERAAEQLWHEHGIEAMRALQSGETDMAAVVEREWS
jgi:hypothetical protein